MNSIFKKKARPSEDMSLQITAMADIFTVVLVFLLKSYATGSITINPTQGLLLPEASSEKVNIEALKVEISEGAVLIENQPVTKLMNFGFNREELQSDGSLRSLEKALKKERGRQVLIAKENDDVKLDPKILVVADQRVPYETIKAVLASAATQGYTDFKLAVVRNDGG